MLGNAMKRARRFSYAFPQSCGNYAHFGVASPIGVFAPNGLRRTNRETGKTLKIL